MSHTEREILSQPDVWQKTLSGLDVDSLRRADEGITDILITGCGSTHYLAMTAAALLRDAGRRAWALPASELLEQARPPLIDPKRTMLLAISRSGTTTETARAVESFRNLGGGRVAVITCYPQSPLADAADVVWAAPDAAEQSVAQTRSFTSMQLITSALAGALHGADLSVMQHLPPAASSILAKSRTPMADLARDESLTSFYFLASGSLFGIASEAMLKLKEMSLTSSEAYHAMEFRHGPMSMCDESAAVIALLSRERSELERAVLNDIAPFGAREVTIGASDEIPSQIPSWAAPSLYLLPLQLLALERALAKGLDPDHPRHLTAVIELDAAGAS
ncbi:MAG TPA: SIS domain-containing protein [Actinomycetes bacterium]|nr:SIS domain-containing protein [Actinomycetes bacterium]